MTDRHEPRLGPIEWNQGAKRDFDEFPVEVRDDVMEQLAMAAAGEFPGDAKPLTGFGSQVMEIRTRFRGDAFRTVYTTRIEKIVYVIHAFQKKATQGISTPKREIQLVKKRLQAAERHIAQLKAAKGAGS